MTVAEAISFIQGHGVVLESAKALNQKLTLTERQSLSAHQAAEPQPHIGRESRSGYCPVANLDHTLERRIMRRPEFSVSLLKNPTKERP